MCVRVHVCMCMCVCAHVCVCACIRVRACMCVYGGHVLMTSTHGHYIMSEDCTKGVTLKVTIMPPAV